MAKVQGHAHPHAQYIAVSPTNNLIASGGFVSNVAASTVTYTYQPSPVTLEFLLPHDHLVIQDTALTLPTVKLARSTSSNGCKSVFPAQAACAAPGCPIPESPAVLVLFLPEFSWPDGDLSGATQQIPTPNNLIY